MSQRPKAVLLFSHDLSYAFCKTTEAIASALRRMGIDTLVRDSCTPRNARQVLMRMDDEKLELDAERSIAEGLNPLIERYGIDCVIGLDLQWFFLPDYFTDHPRIKKMYSIWFDEFHSWCGAQNNAIFPFRNRPFLELVQSPKVTHCFYGEAMAHESREMGFVHQMNARLAASRDFLSADYPCLVKDKLAFIGNPGLRSQPDPKAVEMMKGDAEIEDLRRFARIETLRLAGQGLWPWLKEHPDMLELLALATKVKIEHPYVSAIQIINLMRENFPEAFDWLNKSGQVIAAASLIKTVNRYQRPALITRLYHRGLVEVLSSETEWKPYGVEAGPSVTADHMPEAYMKYIAHINAANAVRDATANEKLFEIAACARVSINFPSPDVCSCYDHGEIYIVNSLAEAEQAARDLIAHPDKAFEMGQNARRRTAREHTWEHRLRKMFENFPSD